MAGGGHRRASVRTVGDVRDDVVAVGVEVAFEGELVPGSKLAAVALRRDHKAGSGLFLDSQPGGAAVVLENLLNLGRLFGAAAIGFQSFKMMTFTMSRTDKRFTAESFKFTPSAVSDAADSAPGMLIGQLQSWASSVVLKD